MKKYIVLVVCILGLDLAMTPTASAYRHDHYYGHHHGEFAEDFAAGVAGAAIGAALAPAYVNEEPYYYNEGPYYDEPIIEEPYYGGYGYERESRSFQRNEEQRQPRGPIRGRRARVEERRHGGQRAESSSRQPRAERTNRR